eukprot:4283109-Pleurochrysis_carterae.AAC.1
MKKQIQEVLRKAGEASSERGTAEEREDLKGVVVNSVQQLYVSVRGMTTSAATNKCEFGYTTPSGGELRWGPTKFTLHAEYHKRSLKVKTATARTYHTVRGALTLNEQAKWCELCACAHWKGCEKLRAYRTEEARRTQELMEKARRGTAPSRAQLQAARPEYTLDVEQEKQARSKARHVTLNTRRGLAIENVNDACLLNTGAGRQAARDLRGGSGRNRWSERRTQSGTGRATDADGLQGVQGEPRELPLYAAKVQVFPLQSPQ